MFEFLPAVTDLSWPFVIALAWIAGELGHRLGLPRISVYGLVGFGSANAQLGILPASDDIDGAMLANIAFGLILFEFGYRINLRWLRTNRWLAATGLLESLLTFACVYAMARAWGSATLTALLLASLSMATSPASLMRVVNEQRSSGQVTERVLHLAAVNCVLALFAFKVVVGFWTFESSGNLLQAVINTVVALLVSAGLGAAFGSGVPALLRMTRCLSQDVTIAFAIAVVVLVAVTHVFKFSPLVACLAFGLVARHRRITLNQTQRNFGALGDLLAVILFAHVAATIEWPRLITGLSLGLALVGVRMATKVAGSTALARLSGVSWRKGVLTGLAMMPLSVFVVLLLEDTRYVGIDLIDTLAPLATATLLLDILGPLMTQYALRAAGEAQEQALDHLAPNIRKG